MAKSNRQLFLDNKKQNKKSVVKCSNTTEVESPESQVLATHCWSICNIRICGGRQWHTPNNPWIQGQQYGPFAFQTNPFNPSWTGTWSAQTLEFDAFYDWVVSEVGSVNVGDTIQFDMSVLNSGMCSILGECAEILCFKYEGFLNWNNGFGWAVTNPILPIAIRDNCCDYIPNLCYNIGDTGPEGGIIFSVPGVGPNTSIDMYYEVAQGDIAIANTSLNDFNTACLQEDFITQYAPLSYTAVSTAIEADHNILIDTGLPANSQFLNGLNSGVIAPGTLVNTGLTPNNQPMFNYTPTVPGEPIVSINYLPNQIVELVFNTAILNSYIPPLTTNISFFTLMSFASTNWGAEWGAYNIPYNGPPPTIQTSIDFSFGTDNTDIIDAFPLIPGTPTGGTHPWSSTHGIAATLCKNYGTTNDWFLPSEQEFREIVNQLGSFGGTNQITFNSFGQNLEHFYWTSSQYIGTDASLQDPDKYSYAYDADTNNMELAWRCHALSVRPIRRFECEPEIPCVGCDCVEYTHRDGLWALDGGFGNNSADTFASTGPPASVIHWNTTNEGTTPGTPPANLTNDSVLGGNAMNLSINRRNVLGVTYTNADFYNNSGFTISAWDTKYNFIGKWKYSNLVNLYGVMGGGGHYAFDRPGSGHGVQLRLENVQHLEGNYPVVDFSGKPDVPGSTGSYTGIFLKVEWDGDSGVYETGCNSTIFGNPHPYYTPKSGEDFPYYCGPYYFNGVYQQNISLPRYATVPPLDINGVPLPVYPTIYQSNPYITSSPFGSAGNYYDIHSAPSCVAPPPQNHCFSVCAIQKTNGNWHPVPSPWFQQEPYGPIAMENNPQPQSTTPPYSTTNPAVDQDYTNFYDWIVSQAPTLAIGDSFVFHTVGYTMQHVFVDPNGVVTTYSNVIATCYKYEGIQTYTLPCDILNDGYSLPLVGLRSCCLGPESTVSSSSLTKPTENNPNSIKIKVNARTLTKREEFIKSKKLKETNLLEIGTGSYTRIIPKTIVQPEQQETITQLERRIQPEEPEEETPPPSRGDTEY
jgi:hypothetical protein